GLFGEVVEAAGLIQPEPPDPGATQRGEVAADAEGRADVARQRPDIRTARTVDLNIDIDEFVVTTDGQHIEPFDADGARRQFDRVALTDQFVGPLTADLDGADRRRHLRDLAAQRGNGS